MPYELFLASKDKALKLCYLHICMYILGDKYQIKSLEDYGLHGFATVCYHNLRGILLPDFIEHIFQESSSVHKQLQRTLVYLLVKHLSNVDLVPVVTDAIEHSHSFAATLACALLKEKKKKKPKKK